MGYAECSAELTVLKCEYPWLREADATALQSALRALQAAHQNFYRRLKRGEPPGFPHFKSKKNRHQSYKAVNNGSTVAVLDRHVKLPKRGLVRAAISKKVEGRILSATVSQAPSGKYFVSICCTDVEIPQYEATGAKVGLDVGIKSLIVTSDGMKVPNHKHIQVGEETRQGAETVVEKDNRQQQP